jgi:hypothetical protein
MARIRHEELVAMAAFALPDGVHASHLTAPLSQRQPFRPSHFTPVHEGRKSIGRRRTFLNEALEENPPKKP